MANREYVFFYAPTWDFPPDGPIQIGNVLTSVKKPHRPLSCSPLSEASHVFKTEKRTVQYTKEKMRGGKFSILTKFLSVLGFGVDIGAEADKSQEETFMFKTLETAQFSPTSSYLQACIENDSVRRFLQISRYRKPVYIITGLKVVTGAEANTRQSRSLGGSLALEVDGTLWSGGGGGPGLQGKVDNKAGTKWEGSSDFVFAFRVSKLLVGKKTGQLKSEEEYRRGAMLGDEVEDVRGPDICVLEVEDPDAQAEGFNVERVVEDECSVLCTIPRQEEADD